MPTSLRIFLFLSMKVINTVCCPHARRTLSSTFPSHQVVRLAYLSACLPCSADSRRTLHCSHAHMPARPCYTAHTSPP
ncbi:hypothetical protein IWX90DRAFT_420595 [Phyllosticta citrichinensis]|uniref:Secreted protein n=1 Tax=Phyllosticta citrichinensis TaxID=1130410 RepID=A0ABR1Y695_9PEZI